MNNLKMTQKIRLGGMLVLLVLLIHRLPAQTLGWGDGVNLQPSYYNSGNVDLGWALMNQQSKIKTVRMEIEPQNGDGDGAPTIATVQRWISEANANGKNVICTYHDWQHNGSDDVNALIAAANWWKTNYSSLRTAGAFTVNLMNEWGSHNQTPSSYAAAYNNAIKIVREVYSGPLIIDIPGWGQETQAAKEASSLITDQNIVFSTHIYGSAYVQYGVSRTMTTADLDVLGSAGRPVIVGEFGSLQSGGADWSGLVDHARSKGWTLIGWAWNGDGTQMNMVSPYWGDNPNATTFTTSSYFPDVYNKLRSSTTANLTVTPTSLSLNASSSTGSINITSNTSWTASSNQSWLTITPTSGSNNGSITVSASANPGSTDRSGTVTVSGGGITRTVNVTQSGVTSNGTNLAFNKPVTVSSTESTSYSGSNAVDGNTSTRWSSAYSDPQWIYIDLQGSYSIDKIVLNWEAAYGKGYQIQVSNDASNWTSVYSTTSGNGGIDELTVSGIGRYVRLYGTSRGTSWGYSLWEFQVFGTASSTSLTVSPTTLSVGSAASNQSITITSNTSWTVTDNQSWISVSPSSGINNGSVTISVTANTASASRTGTVAVSGGGITRTVSVIQSGASLSNIALNKLTNVSSTDGYAGGGAQAVDGNNSTRWASAWSDPQWIYIDLQGNYDISRVVLNWETAYAKAYQIQTSNDASSWTTIYSTSSGDGGTDDITLNGSGRFIRMYGTSRATSWGYSLWEFQVFGASSGARLAPIPYADKTVKINVFPNPVMERLHIAFPESSEWNYVTLVDKTGKTLLTKEIQSNTESFDMSNLPQGLYIIHLKSKTNKASFRILKK